MAGSSDKKATYDDILAGMKLDDIVNNYGVAKGPIIKRSPDPSIIHKARVSSGNSSAGANTTNGSGSSNVTLEPPFSPNPVSSFADIAGDQYEQLVAAQQAQLEAAYNKQIGDYNSQRQMSEQDYRSLVNQAAAGNAMQERARREGMANMGLSGAGGMSRTQAQMASNNLANQLGSIKLQERQYNEEVDRALADLANQYNADRQNAGASIGTQKLSDQLAYDQWKAGYELQRDQYNTSSNQWNQEFAWNVENAKLNQLIDLFRSKRISKKQFEALSGIKL